MNLKTAVETKRKYNEKREEKKNKTEQSISKLWDNFKWPNICATRPLKAEEKGVGMRQNIWRNNGWKIYNIWWKL